MIYRKVAVVTSKESWFVPFAVNFIKQLNKTNYHAELFFDYSTIPNDFEVIFILSYFKLVPENQLKLHKMNLVVHESHLPLGKGWSPFFWQVLGGKTVIPVVLFEAVGKMDAGDVYLRDCIYLEGTELHLELRKKQAAVTFKLCRKFLKHSDSLKPLKQSGKETIFRKRTALDSQLNIKKSIQSQFNLLRIVNNKEYPAFFVYKGKKFIVKITKDHSYEPNNR